MSLWYMNAREYRLYTYMYLIIALGVGACALSVYKFTSVSLTRIDGRFLLLVLITLFLGPYLTVKIPRLTSQVTVSDTFIFLTMLLYGGEAAILLAALEALCSSMRFSRKALTIAFNFSVMAFSTFLTVLILRTSFGPTVDIARSEYSAGIIVALCIMALSQYGFNSSFVAIQTALKLDKPVWQTWSKYYLWTSITYFAGASTAGIIARLVNTVGFYSIIVTTPIIAIIFLTYRTYRRNIEASAAQIELAERHAEELSRFIAELKHAEEERDRLLEREQEARAEAEAANRMKDDFLAMVSHELRTPLTPILGWVHMLRTETVDPETLATALASTERAARAQEIIINDLLDVSRIVRGELHLDLTEVNLEHVVESALEVIRPAAKAKDIPIGCHFNGSALTVSGDDGRLRQVVWNLLSNAVKFTPVGGEVEITLERVGSTAQIWVIDSGMGISADFLPHVFERFRQARTATSGGLGGLGLGLAITKYLAELHGGTVQANSGGHGHGATFVVSLPLTSQCNSVSDLRPTESTQMDPSMFGNNASLRPSAFVLASDRSSAFARPLANADR
jgi:signal transduction histidine kinase